LSAFSFRRDPAILVALDELTSGIGEDERVVAFGLGGLRVAIQVVAAVDIRILVAVPGDVAKVLIEAAIRRPAAWRKTEIPFAETTATVSRPGQVPLSKNRQDLLRFATIEVTPKSKVYGTHSEVAHWPVRYP